MKEEEIVLIRYVITFIGAIFLLLQGISLETVLGLIIGLGFPLRHFLNGVRNK